MKLWSDGCRVMIALPLPCRCTSLLLCLCVSLSLVIKPYSAWLGCHF